MTISVALIGTAKAYGHIDIQHKQLKRYTKMNTRKATIHMGNGKSNGSKALDTFHQACLTNCPTRKRSLTRLRIFENRCQVPQAGPSPRSVIDLNEDPEQHTEILLNKCLEKLRIFGKPRHLAEVVLRIWSSPANYGETTAKCLLKAALEKRLEAEGFGNILVHVVPLWSGTPPKRL